MDVKPNVATRCQGGHAREETQADRKLETRRDWSDCSEHVESVSRVADPKPMQKRSLAGGGQHEDPDAHQLRLIPHTPQFVFVCFKIYGHCLLSQHRETYRRPSHTEQRRDSAFRVSSPSKITGPVAACGQLSLCGCRQTFLIQDEESKTSIGEQSSPLLLTYFIVQVLSLRLNEWEDTSLRHHEKPRSRRWKWDRSTCCLEFTCARSVSIWSHRHYSSSSLFSLVLLFLFFFRSVTTLQIVIPLSLSVWISLTAHEDHGK